MGFFDVINIYGLLFTIVLVVPHVVFARTQSYDMSAIENRAMLYIERAGKYCGAFLMFVNLGVLEKGFTSDLMKSFWIYATLALLLQYVLLWIIFFKRKTKALAIAITITTGLILILSGLLQVKTLLLTAGVVYLISELYITNKVFE